MRIEYEYEGNDYTAYVGVAGPEETGYALIGEQLDTHNLGCGFISFNEQNDNLDVSVTGYNSAGKTEDFKDNAVDAVTWHYPFLTPDMLEVVPKESKVTIFSIYYATPEGKVFLNDTPIILHSCSEVRIREGVFIPVPVSPYPEMLPEPGTGAVGSGTGGDGGSGGGGGDDEPTPEHWAYTYYTQSSADHTRRTLVQANDDGLSDLFNACEIYGYRQKYQSGWNDSSEVSKCFLISEESSFVYDMKAGILNKDGLKAAIDGLVWVTKESTRLDGSKYYVQTTYIAFLCEFYNPDTNSYSAIMGVGGVNLERDI